MIIAKKSYPSPEPNMNEVYRYMGVHGEADDTTKALAYEAVEKVKQAAVCRVCFARLPIVRPDDETLVIGTITTKSVYLAKNLAGCGEVYIFLATLGSAIDRMIASAKHTPSKALAIDASASALTEALCNKLNAELKERTAAEGKFLRPRYSAGFADFTLEYQKHFVEMLNTPKNIGVALRNGTMLFPTKSVSALIGISDEERKL
ncbi:MAG: hypothetical protein LUE88_03205 [Clostridiales bacterium]|nr:hypothetical protein [Clostridiales bacterium]